MYEAMSTLSPEKYASRGLMSLELSITALLAFWHALTNRLSRTRRRTFFKCASYEIVKGVGEKETTNISIDSHPIIILFLSRGVLSITGG